MSLNFQEILKELEYRVEHGIIDLTKEEQVTKLMQILIENGVSNANELAQKTRVYYSYLQEIEEAKPKVDIDKVLNQTFVNPETKKNVKVASALGYDKKSQAYNIAKGMFQKAGFSEKDIDMVDTAKGDEEQPIKKGNTPQQQAPNGKKLGGMDFKTDAEKGNEKPQKQEPTSTNPYAKPGQKVTDPKKVAQLMKSDTQKVINALNKTKAQEAAEKEAAKKAGKKLGVGAGTAASRAGECAVVSGGKTLTELINKGVPFEKAIKKVEADLRKVVSKPDTLLDDAWVDSAVSTLSYIQNTIGFKNIKQFTWDTDEGRAVVGSEGHGTSSDCFMQLKNGSRVGLSLKKDLNVFVFSGGMSDMMDGLEEKGLKGLPTLDEYKERRTQELTGLAKFANNAKTHDAFCKDFANMKKDPSSRFEAKGLTNRLQSIEKAVGKPLAKANCNEFIQSVVNSPKGDNIKIMADIAKTSDNPTINSAYRKIRGLDGEMTDKVKESFTNPKNKHVVDDLVKNETHINDVLFPENDHLDRLMVVYGEEPAIEMKKENLVSLLGIGKEYAAFEKEKDPKKKALIRKTLDEKINSQIKVTDKGGVMSVGIDIGKGSIIPIFEARVRTRGIGNAPTFEMPQSRFGGLAFKNGTTDFTKWKDPKDRIDVVNSMSKELINDFEDLDLSNKKVKAEVIDRIKRLQEILPPGSKNKALLQALEIAKKYKIQ
jgi:hypothetical protein